MRVFKKLLTGLALATGLGAFAFGGNSSKSIHREHTGAAPAIEGFGHVASLGMVDNVWKAEGYYNEIGRNSPGYAIGGVGALVVGTIATGGAGAEIEGGEAGVDALDGGKALDGMPNEASEPMGGENDGQPTNEGNKPCRGTNCFVADTPVQVEDGTFSSEQTEPIQDVQPGSSVETANPSDGLTREGYTTAYYVHPAFEVDSISFGDSAKGPALETITCTTGHKFFTPGGQLPACELTPGSVVCTRDGHGMVVLRNVEKHGVFTVYNFTVDKDHTYYVGKHHGGIWVHNQGSCGDPEASDPLGRRGDPLSQAPGRNGPGSVNGVDYTGHAFDRMQERGIMPSMVEEALNNGARSLGQNGRFLYDVPGLRVVTEPGGLVVTVIPK